MAELKARKRRVQPPADVVVGELCGSPPRRRPGRNGARRRRGGDVLMGEWSVAGRLRRSPTVAPPEALFDVPETAAPAALAGDVEVKALLEAIVYITEEPLSAAQVSAAIGQPRERIQLLLDQLVAEYDRPERGLTIREVAGGYKMATKPEHHDSIRAFVRSLKPPLKLSLAALETLAVIAYKQPITAPEIMEIRGVQGAGVLKTLLDRKLIAAAGRKNVIGKPILYKTTKDFLIQFGLKDLNELPSLKEFEDIRRLAMADSEPPAPPRQALAEPPGGEARGGLPS